MVLCREINGGCKKKTGHGKGPVEQRTTGEEALREAALLAAILDQQLDEDLNRPDGKKNGIIGGKNPDGIDNPIAQAVAVAVTITVSVVGLPGKRFIQKIREAARQKAPLIINEVDDGALKMAEENDRVQQGIRGSGKAHQEPETTVGDLREGLQGLSAALARGAQDVLRVNGREGRGA